MGNAKMPFIKVMGEDGVFFDRVKSRYAKMHIQSLVNDGYSATVIPKEDVPPCIYRSLTYHDDGSCEGYIEYSWKGGSDFYFPEMGIKFFE